MSPFLFLLVAFLSEVAFNAFAVGGVAGFLARLIGTGGAIRGLALAAFHLEKANFAATFGRDRLWRRFQSDDCLSLERLSQARLCLDSSPRCDRFPFRSAV